MTTPTRDARPAHRQTFFGAQSPETAVQPPEPPIPASMGGLVHFPAPEPHH